MGKSCRNLQVCQRRTRRPARGQRRSVNPSAYAYAGSNPAPATEWKGLTSTFAGQRPFACTPMGYALWQLSDASAGSRREASDLRKRHHQLSRASACGMRAEVPGANHRAQTDKPPLTCTFIWGRGMHRRRTELRRRFATNQSGLPAVRAPVASYGAGTLLFSLRRLAGGRRYRGRWARAASASEEVPQPGSGFIAAVCPREPADACSFAGVRVVRNHRRG